MADDFEDFWEDREASKQIVGKFANRFYVYPVGDGLVRINIGEVVDTEPSYHTALVVPAERALEFANLIANVAGQVQQATLDELAAYVEAVKQTDAHKSED